MRKIVINGGRPLQGEITISGAKNSVVALIPAIILSEVFKTFQCLMVRLIACVLLIISTEVF